MVLSAKIFNVKERTDLTTIAEKLKGFKQEEEIEEGKVITEIQNLKIGNNYIEGIFSQDIPITFYHREGEKTIIKTIEAPFLFQIYNDRIFLVVLEKKRLANNIANQLSKIIFITTGSIVEARISHETLRKFHESNPEDTKVIFFDNVDIPNIKKLSLYGSQLLNTNLYNEYLSHGNIWYIVFKSKKFGIIVGITRNCVITCFSKIEQKEFLNYIKKEVFPLIE
ncbi:MAG: hypothetical protein LM593_05655 [Candidatus Verstraetearchaeota archaeon]|nr:hypothetical protein [Candidatus Verstraetearchaeota archaeon]